MGIGVFGGMLAATVLAVFLVPLFYRLVLGNRPAFTPEKTTDTENSHDRS